MRVRTRRSPAGTCSYFQLASACFNCPFALSQISRLQDKLETLANRLVCPWLTRAYPFFPLHFHSTPPSPLLPVLLVPTLTLAYPCPSSRPQRQAEHQVHLKEQEIATLEGDIGGRIESAVDNAERQIKERLAEAQFNERKYHRERTELEKKLSQSFSSEHVLKQRVESLVGQVKMLQAGLAPPGAPGCESAAVLVALDQLKRGMARPPALQCVPARTAPPPARLPCRF